MTASDSADDELRRLQRELDGEDVRDAARAVLEPGEELRVLAEVRVAFGDDGPLAQQHPIQLTPSPRFDRAWAFCTRTTVRRIVFSVVLAPLFVLSAIESVGPPEVVDRLVGRAIGGRTCEGPRASGARRVQHALAAFGGQGTHALVTGRRLVLARQAIGATAFTPVSSVPLSDVVAVRLRPRGPLRRRVELRFADGSRVVLAVPSLTHPPSRPAELVAALGSGADQA